MRGSRDDTAHWLRSRTGYRGTTSISELHSPLHIYPDRFLFVKKDSYVLAHLLSHPRTTLESIELALKAYESVRLSFAIMVHRMSRANGRLYEFTDQTWALEREERVDQGIIGCRREDDVDMMRRLREVGQAIVENRKWSWMTDVDADLQHALDAYTELLNGINES